MIGTELYFSRFEKTAKSKFGGGWYVGAGLAKFTAKDMTDNIEFSGSEYYYSIGFDGLFERFAWGGYIVIGQDQYFSTSLILIGLRF